MLVKNDVGNQLQNILLWKIWLGYQISYCKIQLYLIYCDLRCIIMITFKVGSIYLAHMGHHQ